MTSSPILTTHIAAGTIALLAGAAALSFRKGARRHRLAGNAFVISMLVMAAIGAYLAFSMRVTLSVIGGLLTLYLVVTAWTTVARRARRPGILDATALLVGLSIGGVALMSGIEAANSETGLKDGFHPGQYFMFGTVALLAAAGDLRMIILDGLGGAQRIARHLWRMCVALMIAASAFFLGQPQLFPAEVRDSQLLNAPVLLPFLLMLYWLVRVLRSPRGGEAPLESEDAPILESPASRPPGEMHRLAVPFLPTAREAE